METLTLGYSPCPNDTFIFHAIASGSVSAPGFSFREELRDVETLNQWAGEGRLDVTKVSMAAYRGPVRERYGLIRSGGAMGRGCGPLLVARGRETLEGLRGGRIAVPGLNTTAFLLLGLRAPALCDSAVVMPFDRIMAAVRDGRADAGLVIHESRFTYPGYGLREVEDLGAWWEAETGRPIPLGAIIVRRSLGAETAREVEALIRRSVGRAMDHPGEAMPYIKAHSQELSEEVISKHIALYVNEFTVDMGEEGEGAVGELFRRAGEAGIMPQSQDPLFI